MFSIRNGLIEGDALSPLLFNFTLEYAIRMVQVNQDGLKLYGRVRLEPVGTWRRTGGGGSEGETGEWIG